MPITLRHFSFAEICSPLFGFFWLVPGFVEGDEMVPCLDGVWMNITEFEAVCILLSEPSIYSY